MPGMGGAVQRFAVEVREKEGEVQKEQPGVGGDFQGVHCGDR